MMTHKSKLFWMDVFYKYSFKCYKVFKRSHGMFFLKIKMPKKLFLNCITLPYHFGPINIVLSPLWLFSD